jgi:hypothetical protein
MTNGKAGREAEHHRCPVCGKVSRASKFWQGAGGAHALESLFQSFLGRGKGGFAWNRVERAGNAAWLRMMLGILRQVYSLLAKRLRALGGTPPDVDQEPEVVVRPVERVRPVTRIQEVARIVRPERKD